MRAASSARLRRRLAGALLGAGALFATAALLVNALNRGRAVRDAFPTVEGAIAVAGLGASAKILRDPRGVPHVTAVSERDAYVALGFAHAQDRLAQMVWLRTSAQGRLAEVLGAEALPADREARLLDLPRHARGAAAELPPRSLDLLRAYAEGVNGWISRIQSGTEAPPVPLAGLGVPLEAWSEVDSVALVKLHAWALAGTIATPVLLQDLIERLGGFGARAFFPPGVGLETLPGPARAPLSAGHRERTPPRERFAWFEGALRTTSGLAGRSLGSSAFVVSGRHTRSGLPVLAADSHLPTRAPALLYQAHLDWRGGRVAGATIPGAPLFWTGHNGQVAWGSVHAGAVVVDLFVETLHATQPRYHDGRKWRDLVERREKIAVRGRPDEELVVRETANGPLVNDLLGDGREPLALAWSGARRGDPISAFLRLPRAANALELRQALESHHEPVLAVAYADREGAAGIQLAGWIPQRSLPTGLVPVPGRNRWYAWKAGIPADLLPGNGAEPFAVAADAPLTSPADAVVIEWLWRTGTRERRMREILHEALARGPLDLRDAALVHQDVESPGHRSLVEEALSLAAPVEKLGREERWVANALREWDGESRPESVGATVYHVFLQRLLDSLLEARIGKEMAERYLGLPHVDPVFLLERLLRAEAEAEAGAADPATPTPAAAWVERSLRDTWLWLSVELGPDQDRWGWGRVHQLTFQPLWNESGWERSGLGPFPAPGDGSTVAVAEYDPSRPFDVRLASTFRFALDLASPQEALTSLAPGQSGHPGHPQSVDGVGRWREGRPRLLATSPLLVEEMAVSSLVLEPLR
jgi:penicillin amidase